MRALLPFFGALALPFAVTACDSGGPTPPPPPPPDEVVEGVNLSRLFEAPARAEVETVRADWAERDRTRASRYTHTELARATAPDGATLVVLAARATGGGALLHHAVVRLPPRPTGDVARRPVVLVLPEDAAEVTVEDALEQLPLEGPTRDAFVYAISTYRGQTLRVGQTTYASSHDPAAAYDLDAEDALALLEYVRTTEPLADPARTGASGFGRGGTAALLAEARGGPFDFVASLAAPTDFFLPSVRNAARAYLTGGDTGRLPAFGDVAATAIAPLRGDGGDLAAARLALLRRSPAHFVAPPPFIFAAHGVLDPVVPVAHGDALGGVIGTPDAFYLRTEGDDHRSLPSSSEVVPIATGLFRLHVLQTP